MNVSIFTSVENNPSIDRYARELAVNFPAEARVTVIKPAQSPGLKGKIYDRYLKYLRLARRVQGQYNIIVSEMYSFLLLALDPSRTLVVCHDVHPLLFQGPSGTYRSRYKVNLRLMTRARAIVTVSDHTREDLLRLCPFIPAGRVFAIHNGISPAWKPVTCQRELEEFRQRRVLAGQRFVLHVGNDNWYKNFDGLLRAFARLEHSDLLLVKVGDMGPKNAALVGKLGISNRLLHIPRASDEELRRFYSTAQALVFPSVHEGFGWPPLEAMACGCPVVASRCASLPEVCGDACIYIDPLDQVQILEAMDRVLRDSQLRAQMAAAGQAQAKKFKWETTATGMLRLLRGQ